MTLFYCRDKSGADPTDHFLVFHIYPDELTMKVIAAVCEVLGEYSYKAHYIPSGPKPQ